MKIDSIRASKEGNAFHEMWAVRRCLELLLPRDGLCAIAIEGLSTEEATVDAASSEVADLTLYFGRAPVWTESDRLEVLQFKYSVINAAKPLVASDAKKTLAKFAASDNALAEQHGRAAVDEKVAYAFITNRPIAPALIAAIEAAVRDAGDPDDDMAREQLRQVEAATGLSGAHLQNLAKRLRFQGCEQGPSGLRYGASRTLADWTAGRDLQAELRLHRLCARVREKAGPAGADDNLMRAVDVLAVLEVPHESALLPTPTAFSEVGDVVAREQTGAVLSFVAANAKPVLLRAAGGVGKTVLLQSLAASFGPNDAVVIFDCFAGSAYRSPEDERHLARRGLMHIVNVLATRGLCDLILPGSDDPGELLRTARRRLRQVVATLRTQDPTAKLVILIDAADNAAQQARDRSEDAFPTQLLEAYAHEPEPGVHILASCRPEREQLTKGVADVAPFDLQPFTSAEAKAYLGSRVAGLTEVEVATALARSRRNPRVLEHLVSDWEALVRAPSTAEPIAVEELIAARVNRALAEAGLKGSAGTLLAEFMAGLSVLPTPIPIDEYALALGIAASEIESFCADLSPMLDHTSIGVTLRDEPTETFIRERFGNDTAALKGITARLNGAQRASTYAAQALPRLLLLQNDVDAAFALAFSDEMPDALVGDIGKRRLRAARLNAAIAMAAHAGRHDQLTSLLVEMGNLAAVNTRGDEFLTRNPEFVFLADDDEALRRLHQTKGGWPGRRHARLAIVSLLYGDRDNAFRDVNRLEEWRDWHFAQPDTHHRRDHPTEDDFSATAFFLLVDRRTKQAIKYINGWRSWFGFKVSRRVMQLLAVHPEGRALLADAIGQKAPSVGFHAAVLTAGPRLTAEEEELSIKALRAAVKPADADRPVYNDPRADLNRALVSSALLAASRGFHDAASDILRGAYPDRPSSYDFDHERMAAAHTNYVKCAVATALAEERSVTLGDVLPADVLSLLGGVEPAGRKELDETIDKAIARRAGEDADSQSRHFTRSEGERFKRVVSRYTWRIQALAEEIRALFVDDSLSDDALLAKLIELWRARRVGQEKYLDSPPLDYVMDGICRAMVFEALHVRPNVRDATAKAAIAVEAADAWPLASATDDNVWVLARNENTPAAAAELAARAAARTEREDYVESRGTGFAQLAAAILPASRADAVAYYRRGLKELDTIGAGDFELIQELMNLLSMVKGKPLDGEHAQRLMNLCAINVSGEASKFPWAAFAAGAVKGLGPRALAQLSRWDEREEASLEYTLAPSLARFTESGLFHPFQSLALMLLDDPGESWSWRMADYVDVALSRSAPADRPIVLDEVLRQLDLARPSGLSSGSLEELETVIAKFSALRPQFDQNAVVAAARKKKAAAASSEVYSEPPLLIDAEAQLARKAEMEAEARRLNDIVTATDVGDAESIERALMAAGDFEVMRGVERELLDALHARVPQGRRADFVAALMKVRGLHFGNRLDALEKCFEQWAATSPSVADLRARAPHETINRSGEGLIQSDYGFASNIRQLSKMSGVSEGEIAIVIITYAARHGLALEASAWLYLAALIGERAEIDTMRAALTRLLDGESAKLADDRHDGRYSAALEPPASATGIVAGMIWQRLGNPDMALRWRAAHSVRLLAQLKCGAELDALLRVFATDALDAFGDPKIKFHADNARLWLLMGLARAAIDHAATMTHLTEPLEAICFEETRWHVILKLAAADALSQIYAASNTSAAKRARLDAITQPPQTTAQPSKNFYRDTERGMGARAKLDFYLDYEFDKHDITEVARLFEVPHAEVAAATAARALAKSPTTRAMHDLGGRDRRPEGNSRRGTGRVATFGEQLAWHALMDVATDYARTKPLVGAEWRSNPWDYWLRDKRITRRDGLWLADGTDPYPAIARQALLQHRDGVKTLPRKPKAIARAVELSERLGDWFILDGAWTSGDGVDVMVRAAFVGGDDIKRRVRRFASGPFHDVWLPLLKGAEEDDEARFRKESDFTPFVVLLDQEPGLDDYDPFGARSAAERSYLSKTVNAALGLTRADPFGRTWIDGAGQPTLRCGAWGNRTGMGQYERQDHGLMLECRAAPMLAYLQSTKQSIVQLVTLYYCKRDHHYSETRKTLQRLAVVLISPDGSVRAYRTRRRNSQYY